MNCRYGRWSTLATALEVVAILAFAQGAAYGVTLAYGDIIVSNAGAIWKVDPVSGDRTPISTNAPGSGPELAYPSGVVIDPHGSILAASNSLAPAILRIDPATGMRTPVSGFVSGTWYGTGPGFYGNTRTMLQAANGDLYVSQFDDHTILRIDPLTGDRTVVSSAAVGYPRGAGPAMLPWGMLQASDSTLVAFDYLNAGLLKIDIATGNRTPLSDIGHGTGVPFALPMGGLSMDGLGHYVISRGTGPVSLYQIDPLTGNRTILSSSTVGTGPMFVQPYGIALAANGKLVVTDAGKNALFQVDPRTGNRTIISQFGSRGAGPDFGLLGGVAIVVPEPNGLTTSFLGMAFCLLAALAQRSANHWRKNGAARSASGQLRAPSPTKNR